jgi:hypothetical protein
VRKWGTIFFLIKIKEMCKQNKIGKSNKHRRVKMRNQTYTEMMKSQNKKNK